MSTRFSSASSAEIWTHLNALDDDLQNALTDSGPIASGLAIVAGTNWAVSGYRLRKYRGRLTGQIDLTYSGIAFSTAATGALAVEQTLVTLPAGWRIADANVLPIPQAAFESTPANFGRMWWVRVIVSGAITIRSGLPSQTFPNGGTLRISLDHQIG